MIYCYSDDDIVHRQAGSIPVFAVSIGIIKVHHGGELDSTLVDEAARQVVVSNNT